MPPSLLITRPSPDDVEFARDARHVLGADVPVVRAPLIEIEPLAIPDPGDAQSLILTSKHALFAAPLGLPLWVVGPKLGALARAAGHDLRHVAPDAAHLLEHFEHAPPPAPALHLHGDHMACDVAAALRTKGHAALDHAVYHQHQRPLTSEARTLLEGEAAVILPLFSPRTCHIFFQDAAARAPLVVLALSNAVAARVPRGAARAVIVADRPDAEAMLMALPAAWEIAKRVEGENSPQ